MVTYILHIIIIESEHIEFLHNQRQKAVLKIPKTILSSLILDSKKFKAVCMYLELKPLFYDGRFRSARSNVNSLCGYLQMSKRSYQYKLKVLKDLGLAHYNKKGDLILCSWRSFFECFGVKYNDKRKYKFYRLKYIVWAEDAIRQILIEENFKKQNKAIDIKVFKQEILHDRQMQAVRKFRDLQFNNSIPTKDKERRKKELLIEMSANDLQWKDTANDPEFKKFKQSGKLGQLFIGAHKAYENHLKTFNSSYPIVNTVVSVSCQKVAQLYGLKSKSSGYYWQQILKGQGQLKIKKRSMFVPALKVNELQFAKQQKIVVGNYFRTKKGYFRRLNNHLQFTPLVTA